MQILANRLSLIMYNPTKERRLKLGLLLAIGLINASVFCIWVPARLQISQGYIRVNFVWDRAEKAIFAAIDLSLNTYFMWLLKTKLIASGLTQYNLVYKYNIVMVGVSISLDVSLPRSHPTTSRH
jgi:trafficking protein particle complex subunit 12